MKTWEERFDKAMSSWLMKNRIVVDDDFDSVKSFISQELQKQKEGLTKIIKMMKQQNSEVSEYYSGYNQALDDIIKKLEV